MKIEGDLIRKFKNRKAKNYTFYKKPRAKTWSKAIKRSLKKGEKISKQPEPSKQIAVNENKNDQFETEQKILQTQSKLLFEKLSFKLGK